MNTDKKKRISSVCIFVNLCLLSLCTGCSAVRGISERISGEPAKQARLLQSPRADDRREAVLFFAGRDYGRTDKYTALYRQIAQDDVDPLVRATAIRSLNRSRDKQATKLFINALGDASPIVRLEAAKALNRIPDPAAAEALLKLAKTQDENRDVRIAAAEALQHYRKLDVGRQLVNLLNQRDFSIAWQARRSLRNMTGRDHRYDEGAWLQYITGPDKPLG